MNRSMGWTVTGLLSLLAACGGGGGGKNDSPAFAEPFNVAVAWQNALTTQRSYSASASVSGNTISLDVQVDPQAASAYPRTGAAASRVDQTATGRVNGGSAVTDHVALYYSGSANLIGAVSDDGTCADVTTSLPLPTAADTGDSGALYSATEYADCSGGAATGNTTTATWSLQSSQGVNYFCVKTDDRDSIGTLVTRTDECVEVLPDGSLGTHVRVTIDIPGDPTLVLTGN